MLYATRCVRLHATNMQRGAYRQTESGQTERQTESGRTERQTESDRTEREIESSQARELKYESEGFSLSYEQLTLYKLIVKVFSDILYYEYG